MISVIIPVINEEKRIAGLVKFLFDSAQTEDLEVIVADGGSSDNTVKKSLRAGAKVIHVGQESRAVQMNVAAEMANGDCLFFLHADTYPPDTFAEDVIHALSNGADSGCYRLSFDSDHLLLRFYSWFTKFDVDLFRFGDQGLFIRRELFDQIGGYNRALFVMEDQEIVKRIKRAGVFKILGKNVVTSARRYERTGVVKLQLVYTIIVFLYYVGAGQEVLFGLYKKLVSKQPH